jgi:hypothetical protein
MGQARAVSLTSRSPVDLWLGAMGQARAVSFTSRSPVDLRLGAMGQARAVSFTSRSPVDLWLGAMGQAMAVSFTSRSPVDLWLGAMGQARAVSFTSRSPVDLWLGAMGQAMAVSFNSRSPVDLGLEARAGGAPEQQARQSPLPGGRGDGDTGGSVRLCWRRASCASHSGTRSPGHCSLHFASKGGRAAAGADSLAVVALVFAPRWRHRSDPSHGSVQIRVSRPVVSQCSYRSGTAMVYGHALVYIPHQLRGSAAGFALTEES